MVVVTLALAAFGGLAFADLDREPFQEPDYDDVADWKGELPGPFAFEAHEADDLDHLLFAQETFQPLDGGANGDGMSQFLIQGEVDVATAEAFATAHAAEEAAEAADDGVVRQGGEVDVVSPVTVMAAVAETDPEFGETFEAADTTNDGVPDQNVEQVLTAFVETAPEEAGAVLEQTDDGEFASMLVVIPGESDFGSDRADAMEGIAAEMADEAGYEVTAVGPATINTAEMDQLASGVVETLLIALLAVLALLAVVYRLVRKSATLGIVTVIPIAMALGLLFGAMALLDQPLTLFTALLVSITIGLGIDYNIHVIERFAQKLDSGLDVDAALREAVTGTGGALLGSALTSGGAFALLVLVPHPQFTSWGLIVALALLLAFVLSVFVLPSLLRLWASFGGAATLDRDLDRRSPVAD